MAAVGFNPLPAFGPGDTSQRFAFLRLQRVSIRSRLLGREIRARGGNYRQQQGVSIRSRLLGREIQNSDNVFFKLLKFQSAPGFWAGRYLQYLPINLSGIRFNPLPAFGPGDTF